MVQLLRTVNAVRSGLDFGAAVDPECDRNRTLGTSIALPYLVWQDCVKATRFLSPVRDIPERHRAMTRKNMSLVTECESLDYTSAQATGKRVLYIQIHAQEPLSRYSG